MAGCEFDADEITSTLNRTLYDFNEDVEWVGVTVISSFLFCCFSSMSIISSHFYALCLTDIEVGLYWIFYLYSCTHTHTCVPTHCFNGHFPGKPVLAGFPLDFQIPSISILRVLMGQAKTLHITSDTVPPAECPKKSWSSASLDIPFVWFPRSPTYIALPSLHDLYIQHVQPL